MQTRRSCPLIIMMLACVLWPSMMQGREITLAWDPVANGATGYNLYYWPMGTNDVQIIWSGDETMVTVELPPGAYNFVVTAVDSAAQLESPFSNEVSLAWANTGDLSVYVTNYQINTLPGSTPTYEVSISNLGPEDNVEAVVTLSFDAGFDMDSIGWNCAPGPGARPNTDCPTAGIGSDLSSGVAVSIEALDQVSFTIQAPVLPSATGALSNLAFVSSSTGPRDPVGWNNDDADIDSLAANSCEDNVVVSNRSIVSTEVYHGCDTVRLRDEVHVSGSGTFLILRAGEQIVIENGFSVGTGARLAVEFHPSLGS